MKIGTKTAWVGAAALPLVLVMALPTIGRARQESPAPSDLEARVAALEQIVMLQNEDLQHLSRIADGLAHAAELLAVTANQAEVKGFVEAGANPAARTEILDGFRTFNEILKDAAKPPPAPADESKKKR